MNAMMWRGSLLVSLISLMLVVLGGCNRDSTPKNEQAKNDPKQTKETPKNDPKQSPEKKENDSGWWCDEHGVPESECSMCSAKVAADFKKKGDWCEKHDRAKSQCFICAPSLEAKYAARYEAKYGKKPPVPDENRAKADDKK